MKKSLSLRPVKKLTLTRQTLARVAGEEVSRLDLIAVAGAVRASRVPDRNGNNPGDFIP